MRRRHQCQGLMNRTSMNVTIMLLFVALFVTISNTEQSSSTESSTSDGGHRLEHSPSPSFSLSGYPSATWSTVDEFCDWEAVNITCPDDNHVLIIRNARYGRLRIGRCVAKNYGHIGCGADVTSRLEVECSAKRRCQLGVISLHGIQTTCPSDLKAYIQLTYECVKVVTPQRLSCGRQQPGTAVMAPTSGLIATVSTSPSDSSLVTPLSPVLPGSPTCPWALRLADYQRVRLTVIDFTKPSTGITNELAFPAPCVIVAERSANASSLASEKMVCGNGRDRETVAYKSTTSSVDIYIGRPGAGRQNATGNDFIIKYEVFGCPTMLAPPGAHVISVDADRVMLRCNDSRDVSWTMTCRDSQWIVAGGDVTGTCPRTPAVASLNPDMGVSLDQNNEKDVLYGVMMIVSLGVAVGVTVGVLMLVLVLLYQRRYRQRKINCGADSYLMKRALSATDPPLINAHMTDSRASSPGDGLIGCDDSIINPSKWRRVSECNHTTQENTPYDLDHMITWSHGSVKQFQVSGRYKESVMMRNSNKTVPGLPSAHCDRHAMKVCRSAPAWRDGFARGTRKQTDAALGRRDECVTLPIADNIRRKQDLWDLCERYGLVECSVESSSQNIDGRAGNHEYRGVGRFELPLIGVDNLDLVGGVVDHRNDGDDFHEMFTDRVHFNCLTSPMTRKTLACAEFLPRSNSRQRSNVLVPGTCQSLSFASCQQHPMLLPSDSFPTDSSVDMLDDTVQFQIFNHDNEHKVIAKTINSNLDFDQHLHDVDNGLLSQPAQPLEDVWMSTSERSPFYFKLNDAESTNQSGPRVSFASSGYTMT